MAGSFALQLRQFAEQTKEDFAEFQQVVTLSIASGVIEMSPVGDPTYWQNPAPPGYVGGRFRGNWQFSTGSPPAGELADIDPGGTKTLARIRAGVLQFAPGEVGYIANNLPYGQRLEYEGWSNQAPAGMVRVTMARIQLNIAKEAERIRNR